MQITINLTDPRATSIALDEVIFAQAETTLTFNVSPSTESLADGLSVALLTAQGETLAHALVSASTAILNTSTVECYEFAEGLPVEATRGAYLVIGDSTHPLAIIPVQVARNPIAEIAPPTETAPIYPTAIELQEILAEITQAKGDVVGAAEIAVQAKETAQRLVDSINYSFDITTKDVGQGTETFIAPAEKDGITPRLDNNGQDIHGVSGFSGDRYNNARFLLDWDLSRSNNTAYLASYMTWEGNRGFGGTNTFVQPLIPANKGTTAGAIPLAIPCFENSPLYWSGWFMFNDASNPSASAVKQILLDWSKVNAGGQGTIALTSDVDAVAERVTAVEEEAETKLDEATNYFQLSYEKKVGNFNALSVSQTAVLHEGFVLYDSYATNKYRLLIPATNSFVYISPIGTVRFVAVGIDETKIYHTRNSTPYLTIISGHGESLAETSYEALTAFPAQVEGLSGQYALTLSNGCAVCVNGNVLSADFETLVGTYSGVSSLKFLTRKSDKILYFDKTSKKLASLYFDASGALIVSQNGYNQNTSYDFYLNGSYASVVVSGGFILGTTSTNGYLYKHYQVYVRPLVVILHKNGMQFLFTEDGAYLVFRPSSNTFDGDIGLVARHILPTPSNIIYDTFSYMRNQYLYDLAGNVLLSKYCIYHAGANQPYLLYVAK